MRSIRVMEAFMDWEEVEAVEEEAKRAGVPIEYYFVEGWRKALWDAMKERQRVKVEVDAAEVAARHRAVDENADAMQAILRRNMERRHKRRPADQSWR